MLAQNYSGNFVATSCMFTNLDPNILTCLGLW